MTNSNRVQTVNISELTKEQLQKFLSGELSWEWAHEQAPGADHRRQHRVRDRDPCLQAGVGAPEDGIEHFRLTAECIPQQRGKFGIVGEFVEENTERGGDREERDPRTPAGDRKQQRHGEEEMVLVHVGPHEEKARYQRCPQQEETRTVRLPPRPLEPSGLGSQQPDSLLLVHEQIALVTRRQQQRPAHREIHEHPHPEAAARKRTALPAGAYGFRPTAKTELPKGSRVPRTISAFSARSTP